MYFTRHGLHDLDRRWTRALWKAETADTRVPVDRQNIGRRIGGEIFIRVPKRAIVRWIDRKSAVIAPSVSERENSGVCFDAQAGEEDCFAGLGIEANTGIF